MAQVLTIASAALHIAIIAGLGTRVVMRRRPVGTTLAWLVVIIAAPLFGALCYVTFGESRLGDKHEAKVQELLPAYRAWLAALPRDAAVDWSRLPPESQHIHGLAVGTVGIPALAGGRIDLLDDAQAILRAIRDDVERAQETVHLQFYIWNPGGTADEVAAALVRAARRGVACRVLLDSYGSRRFLRHEQAARLRAAGVRVVEALPTGLLRQLIARADHRMHRKVAVIDGVVGYTGSLNLVDPRFFGGEAAVGEWVDAMARLEGPAVEALAVSFIGDWEFETGEGLDALRRAIRVPPRRGEAVVQVVPSGPGYRPEAIHKLLLMTIYAARREILLTTPYFVPSEALLTALQSAAERGVATTVIVPARNDSFLVHYASRSTFDDLLGAGVRVARFGGGLLHTKSITIDGRSAVFGSVNLDPRSFYLNFEMSLFVYDAEFTERLRALQERYLAASEPVDAAAWARRPLRQRFIENACHLAGPLL